MDDRDEEKCSICSAEGDDLVFGTFGTLPVAFCCTCMSCMEDMFNNDEEEGTHNDTITQ